jgi:hypothetical protein
LDTHCGEAPLRIRAAILELDHALCRTTRNTDRCNFKGFHAVPARTAEDRGNSERRQAAVKQIHFQQWRAVPGRTRRQTGRQVPSTRGI